MDNNELCHYGILGMRWGVRRYQNRDGTLTAAGKKRAAQLKSDYEKLTGKKAEDDGSQGKPKSIRDLSDAELRARTNRLNLEKDYYNAQKDYYNAQRTLSEVKPKHVSAGKKFMKNVAPMIGKTLWNDVGKNTVTKLVEKKLGLKDAEAEAAAKLSKRLQQEAQDMSNRVKIATSKDYLKKRAKQQAQEAKEERERQARENAVSKDTVDKGKTYMQTFLIEDKSRSNK